MNGINYDAKYKLIIIGDTMVGKSSFFNILNDKPYSDTSISTIGVDFCSLIKHTNDDKTIKICIWDTAGQEKYKSIIRGYFRDVAGIILMFDLSNKQSFESILEWIKMIDYENTCSHKHPILLLGNKSDKEILVDRSCVNYLCKNYNNIIYYEISCKRDDKNNLEQKLHVLIDLLVKTTNIPCGGIQMFNDENRLITNITKVKYKCCY
jgi:small GTP-binding protein